MSNDSDIGTELKNSLEKLKHMTDLSSATDEKEEPIWREERSNTAQKSVRQIYKESFDRSISVCIYHRAQNPY